MEEAVAFATRMGDGSEPDQGVLGKLFSAGTRSCSSASRGPIRYFTHRGGYGKSKVAFLAPYSGTIIPLDLGTLPQGLIVQKDGCLAAAKDIKMSLYFNQKVGLGLFGGEDSTFQKLTSNGRAFVYAGGIIIEKRLNNELLRMGTGCVVAFEPSLDFNMARTGG